MPLVLISFSCLLSYNILHIFYTAVFLFSLIDIWLPGLNSIRFYCLPFFSFSKLLWVHLNISPKHQLLRKSTVRNAFLGEAPASLCLQAAHVWPVCSWWHQLHWFLEFIGCFWRWTPKTLPGDDPPLEVKGRTAVRRCWFHEAPLGENGKCVFIYLLVCMLVSVSLCTGSRVHFWRHLLSVGLLLDRSSPIRLAGLSSE